MFNNLVSGSGSLIFLIISLVVFLSSYLFVVGLLTLLESSVLGVLQLSSSVCSVGVLTVYQFVLDLLNILGNGVLVEDKVVCNWLYFVIFLVYLGVASLLCILLFNNCFSVWLYYCYLVYILLDSSMIILNVVLFNSFSFKFSSFSLYHIKSMYVFGEGVFVFFYLNIFILFSFLGINFFSNGEDWVFSSYVFGSVDSMFILFSFLGVFLILVLFNSFSVPFDYLEIESEFVGGVSLELYGVLFMLWFLLEYILILNNVIFLISIFVLVFSFSYFMFLVFILIGVIGVFFSSGMLVSVSFMGSFFFLSSVYIVFIGCIVFVIICYLVWV